MMSANAAAGSIRSLVPARLDRLPWANFHWLVVVGLGIAWILDGLEAQISATVGTVWTRPETLNLSTGQVGIVASVYLSGEIVGALFFGRITDMLGRKRLFILTLAIYLLGSGLAGLSFNFWILLLFRFIAGMGIGGEYTAINSAIDELIPARFRGRVDIAVNGTYWAGAGLGAAASLILLNENLLPVGWGWRIGFLIGPLIGLFIIFLRRVIPESPRWLMTHGRGEEAERTVDEIEEHVRRQGVPLQPVPDSKAIEVTGRGAASYLQILQTLLRAYPSRSFLGFTMMATQAFLYNAIFFTYALVLTKFYGIPSGGIGYYFFPFAVGNLIGPLLLGPLFDTIGRRVMIALTYCLSAILLAISGWLFSVGALTPVTQTIFWCVIFFLASAGASSAYLTVSEIFPLELRGSAISLFFAISQIAGVIAPSVFSALIGAGTSRGPLAIGYIVGAGIMFLGGLVAWFFGVNAERKSLEDISTPLTAVRPATATGGAGSS
jgi:MFS family permease